MESVDRCAEPKAKTLTLSEARKRILENIDPVSETECLSLAKARDRVLSEDIFAPFDIPPFANSAMDGFALRSSDSADTGTVQFRARVVGTSYAGHPYEGELKAGECVRIFTGAAIPEGADSVIMQEEVAVEEGFAHFSRPARRLENIRPVGDEVPAKARLLQAGKLLTPADLGLLASAGLGTVQVRRRIRVAHFSTGDELSPLGEALAPGMIYDSNRYTLSALLDRPFLEAHDLGVVRDDPVALRHVLETAAERSDAVVTTGGVSVGDADFVAKLLDDLGLVNFWKVAIKPGKPFAFGSIGRARFFGLPGNPVAVLVAFHELVRPGFLRMAGTDLPPDLWLSAVCQSHLRKAPGRMEFQRGYYEQNGSGQIVVTACGKQGSHRLSGISQANCFIVLPPESGPVQPGETVSIKPYSGAW
jgi:molybdopterin molybdotransferase